MNILISIDMEGVAGVVAMDQVMPTHQEYARFRRLMTAEANAAIEGALEGGATQVVVNDSHADMTNVLIEELNPAATLISGSLKPFGMMQGIGPQVDAVFFVGYHGASATDRAVLEHTWSGRRVVEVSLNGRVMGETGLNAALAGAYGAPVVLVTGDRAVTEEARALLGEVETVAVKEGISRSAAHCIHPREAQEQIRQAAARALRRQVQTLLGETPVTLRVAFLRAAHADMAALVPGVRKLNGCTVEWVGEDMPTTYRLFQALVALASTAEH